MSASHGFQSYDPRHLQLSQTGASTSPLPYLRPGLDATAMSASHGLQSYDPRQWQSTQTGSTTSHIRPGLDAPSMSASHGLQSYDPRQQTSATTSLLRSGTPDSPSLDIGSTSGSSQTSKGSLIPQPLHPINIIHHDDAGTIDEGAHAPETIELPPAYSNIRNNVP
jgi:hypothetical protein